MSDCDKLMTCAFFKRYESDHDRKLALAGLARIYCKGEKQGECIRKKVSKVLGADKVPVNMLPNGYAISGTTSDNWPEDVKKTMLM